jgi:hypothetical protein
MDASSRLLEEPARRLPAKTGAGKGAEFPDRKMVPGTILQVVENIRLAVS